MQYRRRLVWSVFSWQPPQQSLSPTQHNHGHTTTVIHDTSPSCFTHFQIGIPEQTGIEFGYTEGGKGWAWSSINFHGIHDYDLPWSGGFCSIMAPCNYLTILYYGALHSLNYTLVSYTSILYTLLHKE